MRYLSIYLIWTKLSTNKSQGLWEYLFQRVKLYCYTFIFLRVNLPTGDGDNSESSEYQDSVIESDQQDINIEFSSGVAGGGFSAGNGGASGGPSASLLWFKNCKKSNVLLHPFF